MAQAEKTRLELAKDLDEKWKAPRAASRLANLESAITSPYASVAEKSAWAANIHKLIHTDGIVEGIRLRKTTPLWLGILEWIRNFLILVPVMLTWLGISQAVTAYYALVAIDKDYYGPQPFLYLWQDNFNDRHHSGHDLLPPWAPTLGTLATYDAILIGILVALTIYVSYKGHIANIKHEQEAEILREDLTQVLFRSAVDLAQGPGSPNPSVAFSESARLLIEELRKVREQFAEVIAVWKQDQAAMQNMRDALATAATEMRTTADTLRITSGEFATTNTELRGLCGQMATSASSIAASASSLSVSVGELKTQQKDLTDESKKIATGLDEFVKKQDTLMANQAGVVAGLNAFTTRVESSIAVLAGSMSGLATTAKDAVGWLAFYKDETEKMVNALGQMGQDQGQYYRVLQQLTNEQQALVIEMKQIAQPSAQHMQNLSNVMLGVWTEANKTVQLFGATSAKIQSGADSVLMAGGKLAQTMDDLRQRYGLP